MDEIAKEINNASKLYSVVFTSGGVGPTHDDVTYEAVAKALGLKLELHKELIEIYTQLIPDQEEIKRFAIVPYPCEIISVNSTGICSHLKFIFLYYTTYKILASTSNFNNELFDECGNYILLSSIFYFSYTDSV